MPIRFTVAFLTLVAGALAQKNRSALPGPTTTLPDKPVRIPMSHATGHVAVSARLNGEGPFRFLIDTGASGHGRVDESIAKRFGLRRVGYSLTDDSTGKNQQRRRLVRLARLDLGGVTFRDLTFGVGDYKSWLSKKGAPPTVGLLGFRLFAKLLLTIDYPASRVELRNGELRSLGKHTVPYEMWRGVPRIRAQLGRRRFALSIDTGSDSNLILPVKWLTDLRVAHAPRVVARARTTNNEFAVRGTEVREPLFLARHSLGWTNANFAEIWIYPNAGYGVLKRFAVTFDQRNGRVRFAAPR